MHLRVRIILLSTFVVAAGACAHKAPARVPPPAAVVSPDVPAQPSAPSPPPTSPSPDTSPSPSPPSSPNAPPSPAPSPTPAGTGRVDAGQEEADLLAAQKSLAAKVGADESLAVTFEGPAVSLAPPSVVDIEYGDGHGGLLVMVRLSIGEATTKCERVTWQERRAEAKSGGSATRADVPTPTLRPLLAAVRALSRAQVTKHETQAGTRGSAGDVFVLVRVCADAMGADRVWKFAGNAGSAQSAQYAAPDFVMGEARRAFKALTWAPVEETAYRSTHFTDALVRNWTLAPPWVLEASVGALGWFGDAGALPTATWLRDHEKDVDDARLQPVIDHPELYLSGPPREIPVQR